MTYLKSHPALPLPANHTKHCISAATKCYKYLRRVFKFNQMDFEFALWQMVYLFIAPQKVYRNFQYRKQTKSQFARDDPAFLVLFAFWICITSIGFAVIMHLQFRQYIYLILYVTFVDCIGPGIIIATIFWYVLNKYFRVTTDHEVEWGYAFDVHLNAFFPPLTLLHFCQLFLLGSFFVLEAIPSIIGNIFWLVSICYYIYITFLGYNSLQFLQHTQVILVSIPVVIVVFIITLCVGINPNYYLLTSYLFFLRL